MAAETERVGTRDEASRPALFLEAAPLVGNDERSVNLTRRSVKANVSILDAVESSHKPVDVRTSRMSAKYAG